MISLERGGLASDRKPSAVVRERNGTNPCKPLTAPAQGGRGHSLNPKSGLGLGAPAAGVPARLQLAKNTNSQISTTASARRLEAIIWLIIARPFRFVMVVRLPGP